jgi:hypothetical protein
VSSALNHGLFARRRAGKNRMSIEVVEIFGDCGRFRNQDAVVEFEHRDFPRGVHCEKRRLLVLGANQVDADEFNLVL